MRAPRNRLANESSVLELSSAVPLSMVLKDGMLVSVA
jgi:hypothetical protein